MAKQKVAEIENWIPDLIAENYFRDCGFKYTTAEIDLSKIDLSGSTRSNPRFDGLSHQELIDQYAEAMLHGDKFPMVALLAGKATNVELLGGLHRCLAAKKAGKKAIGAYLIDIPNRVEVAICKGKLNYVNGKPLSSEAHLQWALGLQQLNLDLKQISERTGVNYTRLLVASRAESIRSILMDANISADDWPSKILSRLHSYRKSEPILLALANLYKDNRQSADSLAELSKRIDSARTEAAKLKVIRDEAGRLEDAKPRGKRKQKTNYASRPAERLILLLRTLFNKVNGMSLPELGINTPADTEEVRKVWRDISSEFQKMFANDKRQPA